MMSEDPPDPDEGDVELGTAEENLGAPMMDPRVAGLSAAEEYSRPRPPLVTQPNPTIELVFVIPSDDDREGDR